MSEEKLILEFSEPVLVSKITRIKLRSTVLNYWTRSTRFFLRTFWQMRCCDSLMWPAIVPASWTSWALWNRAVLDYRKNCHIHLLIPGKPCRPTHPCLCSTKARLDLDPGFCNSSSRDFCSGSNETESSKQRIYDHFWRGFFSLSSEVLVFHKCIRGGGHVDDVRIVYLALGLFDDLYAFLLSLLSK